MMNGDTFNAATFNDEVDGLVNRVNSRTLDDHVRPRSLYVQHLPSLQGADTAEDIMKGDGMQVTVAAADWPGTNAFENYSNELAPAGNPNKNFQTIAGTGPGAGAGWRRVARGGAGANMCEVLWPSAGITIPDDTRIEIEASVAIGQITNGQDFNYVDHCFALAFVLRNSNGQLYVLERAIYTFSALAVEGQRVSIRTWLNQNDLNVAAGVHGGLANLRSVQLAFGRYESPRGGAVSNIAGQGHVQLGPYNISECFIRHGSF